MDVELLLAGRTRQLSRSAIREILKVASQPGMISLAGGVPAPASFPLALIEGLSSAVIRKYADKAFQYGLTEGFPPLRRALVPYLAARGIPATEDEALITTGSQGVLDAVGKILIAPGDKIGVESPTYLGALQAFAPYEPLYASLACDDEGVVPEALRTVLERDRLKFIYLVPTFQNPTGRTLPLSRRRAIAALLERYDTLLIEDDPYGDLRYQGDPLPSIKSLAPDRVVYVGTLSKVLAPGLRIGFCAAPEPIRSWLVLIKQGVDLHTGTFDQALAAEYLEGGHLQRHLPRILDLYRPRRDAMLAALGRHMPPQFRWSRPEGGMFVWVEGPAAVDMMTVYREALRRGVAFVPGRYFFPVPGAGCNTMRLNFTMPDPDAIDGAVRTLADVIRTCSPRRTVSVGSGRLERHQDAARTGGQIL